MPPSMSLRYSVKRILFLSVERNNSMDVEVNDMYLQEIAVLNEKLRKANKRIKKLVGMLKVAKAHISLELYNWPQDVIDDAEDTMDELGHADPAPPENKNEYNIDREKRQENRQSDGQQD